MVLYFSATGNCKYVATRLAKAFDEESVSITECIGKNRYIFEDKAIGVVSPTYFWGLPSIVKEFLEKASFKTEYLYFVATYGTTPGAVGNMAKKAIQNRSIDACFSVRMADTWTPMFDLSTPETVAKFTKTTERDIDKTIASVGKRRRSGKMSSPVSVLLSKLISQPIYNNRARKTAHFRVENNCIGCGLCARKCPVQAIEMQNGRPVWVKDKCAMCLGCLHRCPKFAIQYGNRTKNHGQYTNPNVKI